MREENQVKDRAKRVKRKSIVCQDGSMTIFFCLILLIVSAVICTCLESARASGLRFMAETAAYSCLQSVFADYHQELWEDYHVFFYDEKEKIEDTMINHLEYYVNPAKGIRGLPEYSDLWGLSVKDAVVTHRRTALSEGGKLFAEQAVEYEKYHAAKEIIYEFADRAGILEEVKSIQTFAARLSGCFEQIQRLSILYQNIRDEIDSLTTLIEQMRSIPAQEITDMESFCEQLRELLQGQNNLKTLAEEYLKSAGETQEFANELETEYGNDEETVYGRQISQLLSFTVKGAVGQAVGEIKDRISSVLSVTGSLLETAEKVREEGSDLQQGVAGPEDVQIRAAEAAEYIFAQLAELRGKIDTAENGIMAEENEGHRDEESNGQAETAADQQNGEDGRSLLEAVRQWKNTGILTLAMGDRAAKIRDDRLSLPDQLPSVTAGQALPPLNALQKGLFVFYIADTFSDALSEDQGFFSCQQEYILFGKPDSRSNAAAAAEALLAVREGLNLVFLLTNERMSMSAESAAYALAGASGLYPLVALTQFMILTAWAFAESVYDLRQLFDGKRIPLWKSENNWKTSLSGLTDGLTDGGKGDAESWEADLSYEDYLKLFLLVQDTGRLCLRSMDVIQQEIGAGDDDFLMADCCAEADITVRFYAPYRLITLPLIGGGQGPGYQIQAVSSYAYR